MALPSDDSEARSDLPAIDVRTSDGDKSLSGIGSILENAELDVTVNSDKDSINFFVESGTVLVSGETYLIINGTSSTQYSLTGSTFGMSPADKVFGLRFSLYDDIGCTGTPVCTAAFYDENTQVIGQGLAANHKLYIKVEVDSDAAFDEAPYLGHVGFSLTATTEAGYNAVYYMSDGSLVGSDLVRNGEQFVFPDVAKEGYVLVGWYDSEVGGKCYSEGALVDLDSDTTLYAHWTSEGSDHFHYTLPDGSEVYIDKETGSESVTLDVRAYSKDKRVTLDTGVVKLATVTDLQYVLHLSGSDDCFTSADAESCVSIGAAVGKWMGLQQLEAKSHLAYYGSGEMKCEPSALGAIASEGFSLEMTNAGSDSCLSLDPKAMASIADQAKTAGSDSKCTLVVREATESDLTEEQKETIGGEQSWLVGVFVDGKEIHDIADGHAEVRFPFELPSDSERANACCVLEDGTRESVSNSYGDGVMVLSLTHLSVYMAYGEGSEGSDWNLAAVALSIIIVIIIAAGACLAFKKKSE